MQQLSTGTPSIIHEDPRHHLPIASPLISPISFPAVWPEKGIWWTFFGRAVVWSTQSVRWGTLPGGTPVFSHTDVGRIHNYGSCRRYHSHAPRTANTPLFWCRELLRARPTYFDTSPMLCRRCSLQRFSFPSFHLQILHYYYFQDAYAAK